MLQKAPRRTRERILELSLRLFNEFGEPNITTTVIAEEMNISPGNLYYHFRNKDDIVNSIFVQFETEIERILTVPAGRRPNMEDVWLYLPLMFELNRRSRSFNRSANALLSRTGARVAFVATSGFADLLTIARQERPVLYALRPERAPSLVADGGRATAEAEQRTGPSGETLHIRPGGTPPRSPIRPRRAASPDESARFARLPPAWREIRRRLLPALAPKFLQRTGAGS